MALIELDNIAKLYQEGNQQVVALDNLSLQFEAGEFAVLAGMLSDIDVPVDEKVLIGLHTGDDSGG